jgi:acyl-CoA reductase-like NAD-dependent aldehyde dehydrogenase
MAIHHDEDRLMSARGDEQAPLSRPERLFIGGEWVAPSTGSTFDVVDSGTEEIYFTVAEALEADVSLAVGAARAAFDDGPWPSMTHAQRAEFLRQLAEGLRRRGGDVAQVWPRESGVIYAAAEHFAAFVSSIFDSYAAMADTFPFDEEVAPTAGGEFGLLTREPVGVVGAIIPWNAPLGQLASKVAPALLAGCTVVVKASPQAPGAAYLVAEIADEIGLPPGVLNVVTADREASEALVRDPRVDKISFTGSTAAGRRVAAICGERIARCTLELGGKSAAVILDDADISIAAAALAQAECMIAGQVCASLTRIIVTQDRHDDLVDALAAAFSQVTVGDPFLAHTQMGPLATSEQRDRVESYIALGKDEGAVLATGGARPKHLDRGWFVEPTVFGRVDNASRIAQEEIFGPVLCVVPAKDERHAVALANDSIYGLNASVFTDDVDRAQQVARQLRSGTVGHNASRGDIGVAFGGYKQSGLGREGGVEGLLPYLETKYIVLDERPS